MNRRKSDAEASKPEVRPRTVPVRSPLHGFAGVVTRSWPSVPYQLGLAVVAFVMLLLPAIYVGLVLLVGGGVWYHATITSSSCKEPVARGSACCSTSARSSWASS